MIVDGLVANVMLIVSSVALELTLSLSVFLH